MIQATVDELSPLVGTRPACRALGASPATVYRARNPPAPRPPVPRDPPARALSHAEREAVLAELHSERFVDSSPAQVWATLLDEGRYLASERTIYRILAAEHGGERERRAQREHPAYARPELLAENPNEVWSWDITKLKGPYTRVSYELYVVIDVFSRKIVAWRVEEHESDELAREMFQAAFAAYRARPTVVHSDGGPAMTSNTLTGLFRDLGIEVSRNRPRVSNDNPYSESLFKTTKYTPTYPAYFTSLEQARDWVTAFVAWYNHEHRHSSLEGHTPAAVHDGTWRPVHEQRVATMARLHQQHPERFHRPPTVRTPMAQVAINHTTTTDRLQTG